MDGTWEADATMPANLTPQYLKAEEAYRRASTPEEELQCLQDMLRELPKHKGTDRLQADLKQKISRAKKAAETARSAKKGYGVRIPRQGAGRVVLLGAPNSGKSQLVRAVTRAEPEVDVYPFTTREPSPAMMPHEDVLVQLIDTPPVTADLLDPAVQGLVRGADLVLLLLNLGDDDGLQQCHDVVKRFDATKTRLAASSSLDEHDVGLSYTKTFLVANKIDLDDAPLRWELFRESVPWSFPVYLISAQTGVGLDRLCNDIFESLNVVRVYTKSPRAKQADFERPFTIRQGGTLGEIAAMIHKDLAANLKFARVWGSQVHDGTTVKADYVLHDKDIIELHE